MRVVCLCFVLDVDLWDPGWTQSDRAGREGARVRSTGAPQEFACLRCRKAAAHCGALCGHVPFWTSFVCEQKADCWCLSSQSVLSRRGQATPAEGLPRQAHSTEK